MSTKSRRWVLVVSMVGAVALYAVSPASGGVLYQDDFEGYGSVSHAAFPDSSGTYNPTSPTVGTVNVNEQYLYNVQVTDHVDATGVSDPTTAGQGAKYLRINDHTYTNDYDTAIVAATGLDQTVPGTAVHWEQLMYIPVQVNGVVSFAAFQGGTFSTPLFSLGNDSAGFIKNVATGAELNLPYTAGQWQKWAVDYTVGASSFTMTVGSNSVSVPVANPGAFGSTYIAAANYMSYGTESIGVDSGLITAVPTPEPSCLAMLAAGLVSLLAYAWRKRKQ
jgi:hypothetical protein